MRRAALPAGRAAKYHRLAVVRGLQEDAFAQGHIACVNQLAIIHWHINTKSGGKKQTKLLTKTNKEQEGQSKSSSMQFPPLSSSVHVHGFGVMSCVPPPPVHAGPIACPRHFGNQFKAALLSQNKCRIINNGMHFLH